MNILDTIIAAKRKEVANKKRTKTISELEKGPFFKNETLSFAEFLLRENKTGIIAEFKRRSPSKGVINNNSTVEEDKNIFLPFQDCTLLLPAPPVKPGLPLGQAY